MVGKPIPARISTRGAILRVDATTAEVTRAFRAAGIRSILLKGPAVARWLYEDRAARPYTDSDLLVSPDDVAAAEDVLRGLGFRSFTHQSATDRRLRPHHALPWLPPPHLGAAVDLHQSIGDVKAGPATVWAVLSADTEEIEVAGATVEVLGVPGRALHAAVHAAHHSGLHAPALEDLRRAAVVVPLEQWRQAVALARAIDGVDELVHGLELVPEGAQLRAALGLPDAPGPDAVLRRTGVPPLARGLNWVLEGKGARERLRRALAAAFPSAAEMRDWSQLARRGRLGLALAYVGRPLWLAYRLPGGWAAARRARRAGAGAPR